MFSNSTKDPQPSGAGNIIGKGTHLEGSITTIGNLRVEGKITGGINAKAKVVLSNSSFVKGNIIAQNAEIGGGVQGTVEALELLILKPTAVIHGDIIARKLVFEEGAKFNGKCTMGEAVTKIETKEVINFAAKEVPLKVNNAEQKSSVDNKKVGGLFKGSKK